MPPKTNENLKKWFEANYLDGDAVQEGQMLASSECLDALITQQQTHHQELQKAREEERERIIKAIRADKNENAENGGEWANGYNAGKFIAISLALQSELDQPNK